VFCRAGRLSHPHSAIAALLTSHPRIAKALWREMVIESSIYREWISSLGRRSAPARLSHFLCELSLRLEALGLSLEDLDRRRLRQIDFADALGLSLIHVNRTFRELREGGILVTYPTLRVLDWTRLRETAEFDPAYLHLKDDPMPKN